MLSKAREKWAGQFPQLSFIEANVAHLPFRKNSFDGVTCSHAFYELRDDTQAKALQEIVRILKKGKLFLMLEHDVPEHPIVRFLFYVRIFFMGSRKALEILGQEKTLFQKYFYKVQRVRSHSGGSKIFVCEK